MMAVIIIKPITLTACPLGMAMKLSWTQENVVPLAVSIWEFYLALVTIVFLIGGMVTIWTESTLLFRNVHLQITLKLESQSEKRWQIKFWKSCRNLIKIRFGANNFVDAVTPL